ncbi:hypothetical protein Tco_1012658 [Tanacetum coccineum]
MLFNEKEQGQSSSRNQEQTNDYDFWTESYASDDGEVLTNLWCRASTKTQKRLKEDEDVEAKNDEPPRQSEKEENRWQGKDCIQES